MNNKTCVFGLFALLGLYPVWSAEQYSWGVVPIVDSADLWELAAIDLDQGHQYGVARNSLGEYVLMMDQNQVRVLDSASVKAFKQKFPDAQFISDSSENVISSGKSRPYYDIVVGSKLPYRAWGDWDRALAASMYINLQSSNILAERDAWGVMWNTKVKDKFWLWLGLDAVEDRGSFASTMKKRDSTLFSAWSWSIGVGVPWIRYQIQKAAWKTPTFMFMEPDAKADLNLLQSSMLKIAESDTLSSEYSSNYLHLIEAKMGHVRFKYWMDSDVYSKDIWQFLIQDLPMGQSTWWMGITGAGQLGALGLGANFFNIDMGNYSYQSQKWNPRLSFYMDTWWRTPVNNFIGLGLRLHVPNFYAEIK